MHRRRGDLPDRARVVVIGGGVIGTSTAYHLARLGWTDVVLLEQGQLSCGTTWHAAGLLGQLRATESGTRLVQYSARLYGELEAETGLATGLKRCGGVTVARTPERMVQLRRTAATAEAYDLECELLTPAQALERYPILEIGDLLGALWLPGDCTVNPVDVTASLARGARMRGVRIAERTRVTGIVTSAGRVTGVVTDRGTIEAEVVVNCAGQWAKAVGLLCGVDVPLHSAEHFYVVTEAIEGVHPDLPILRDPDGYTYVKEEVGGLVVGGFEPKAKPWVAPDALPYPFEFQLLDEDWDHFSVLMESAVHRIPVLQQTGLKKLYNGPESFTPDNQFILGEAPGLGGFFVGAGFNSVGIASGGGAGRALADWIVEGEPTSDLAAVDIRRFAPFNANNRWLRDRVGEVLGLHYAVPWPNRELATARPFRRSPLHHLLAGKGAVFGSKMGWERPNVFAPIGAQPRLDYTWGRPDWLAWSVAEQIATRERVAVFDETSFGKLLVVGRDAETVLQRLCTADVAVEPGRAVYTGMLNERAGYEADVTVTRLAQDRYLLVTSAASPVRDAAWIERHLRVGEHVSVVDVSSAYAVLGVMGPGVARTPRTARLGRPVRRGVPVLDEPGDLPRLRHGAGHPDHLRRGVGLGALRPDRVRGRRVRGPARGRVRPRSRRRRVLRHQQPPSRQGLPGLRLRPHPGLHPPRGGPALHLQARNADRFRGSHGPRVSHRRRAAAAPCLVPARRSRCHALGRRTRAARRQHRPARSVRRRGRPPAGRPSDSPTSGDVTVDPFGPKTWPTEPGR